MRPLKITSEKTRRNLKKKYFINTRIFLDRRRMSVAVEGLNGLRGRHIGRICIMVSLDLIFISVQRS